MEALLTDELWARFEPLVPMHPKSPRGGRPRADDPAVPRGHRLCPARRVLGHQVLDPQPQLFIDPPRHLRPQLFSSPSAPLYHALWAWSLILVNLAGSLSTGVIVGIDRLWNDHPRCGAHSGARGAARAKNLRKKVKVRGYSGLFTPAE